MMNISPIVNSVKCTVLACFVQFWHVLEDIALRKNRARKSERRVGYNDFNI